MFPIRAVDDRQDEKSKKWQIEAVPCKTVGARTGSKKMFITKIKAAATDQNEQTKNRTEQIQQTAKEHC